MFNKLKGINVMGNVMTPDKIAEIGDQIYHDTFRETYEDEYKGRFLAIDVTYKTAHLGDHPEDAINEAEKKNPNGNFYLVKIGEAAAFHVRITDE